jgi:2-methylcitrate dehydratase PrpD
MTALEQLGDYVARGVRDSISESLRAQLTLHVVDTVIAWVATAGTEEARNLRKFQARNKQTSADPTLDILINCALTRLSEVDDIHLASMITPGAIVVPGVLTLAARLGSDVTAASEAIVAGYDAMIRLSLALDGPSILYRGIWPTYVAASFGIAAAAARLFNLSPGEAAHALALALTLSAPGVGHHNAPTGSRWFAVGSAARNGLHAVEAARAGLTSDVNILDGAYFETVFGITPKSSALSDGLGTPPKLTEVSFKPWCAARQTMAATQALREIIDSGVAAADITAIEVSVPPQFLKMIDHGIVGGRVARLTSQPYQIAIAVLAPDQAFDLAQVDEVPLDVLRLMNKITVRADETVLDRFPEQWPARARVRTQHGEQERSVKRVPGDPERPFDIQAVRTKALRLVGSQASHLADQCIAMLAGRLTPGQLLDLVERSCASSMSASTNNA